MVKYFPELRCFASCSPHSKDSFVLEEIDRLYDEGEVRGVSIHKGVNCFEYCAKANIIATGGVDKVIRVWHPHIFSRPTGKLIGHLFTIVDICCNERDQHLISLSTARVFRVWDIHTLTCLQVFTDNEERPGEKRIYSMVFDNKHERLLTGSSVLDSWPLTRAVQDTMQVPHTHDRPISQVLVNKELNQVVTVCTESIIRVWEIESGKRVHVIPEAHGSNIEVTAICLDKSGYRLASGALDGSIKVWDFGSGQEIKGRPGRTSDEDLSITGLMYTSIDGDRCILAAGWNNKIRLILDTNENYDLPVIRDFVDIYYWTREPSIAPTDPFKGEPLPDIGQNSQASLKVKRHFSNVSENNAQITNVFKKDYILNSHEVTCIDSLLPNTLITGAANGNIILWDIDKSVIDKVFLLPEPDINVSPGGTEQKPRQGQHKVNMIKTLIHRERKLDPAYVKKMNLESEREEREEREETGSVMSVKATSRKVSRANSRASRLSNHPVQVDEQEQKELLDQLTARIEGTEDNQDKQEKKEKEEVKEEDDDDDGEEKKDIEKSVDEHDGHVRFENEEEEVDEESKWIVETYDPILVSVHQDANIRFWNFEGTLLREISPVTRRQGTPVTAVCHDDDCNILITGDQKGYLTLWNVAKFLKNPKSEDMNSVKQMICWRAHLVKVISIVYVESTKSILSGSADGSVRVWWGTKGRFIGFFSQHRPFNYPVSEAKAGPAILPYDINEGPLAPVKAKNDPRASQKTQKYEYPLIFDNEKWQPFRRSAYVKERESKRKHKAQPEDKKFFHALIKPRANLKRLVNSEQDLVTAAAYNHHLESLKAADRNQGAVFRALPVYRVRTPEKVSAPETSYSFQQDDESKSYLFGTSSKRRTSRYLTHMDSMRASYPAITSSKNIKPAYISGGKRNSIRLPHMTSVYLSLQAANKFNKKLKKIIE
ncbi:hypothetical protein KUTeg_013971 [Tegillarca granosa]|uniref:WD repeat-containing protein 64 n=1 Tax=Tegillarca granosa TaxID=220873 RepID=A0ABQ9EV88_TEGGR|nr:hypothetical protein KUTeg_013971 [Tegillarca granosa]